MTLRSGLLELIMTLCIVTIFQYCKIAAESIRIVNVRNTHKMQSRSLLYPPTAPTRVQFIGGIGIPVEGLNFESVTSGYVLKAEYFLPETAEVFHQNIKPQTIQRRRKSINETKTFMETEKYIFENVTLNLSQNKKSAYNERPSRRPLHNNLKAQRKQGAQYRWIFYKAIETILNNSALNGRACMLRSICEHAAIPLNYEGGLLAEILHIVLTPSTSRDEPFKSNHKSYHQAEIFGRIGVDCDKVYCECTKSPMEIMSVVF